MARTLPVLGAATVAEIEAAWARPQPGWARRRLQVVRLIAQHELSVAQIMRVVDVSRQTVFTYRDLVVAGGVVALLQRRHAGGRTPAVRDAVASARMNFCEPDRAPEDQLNLILWRALKGSGAPYPEWAVVADADDADDAR